MKLIEYQAELRGDPEFLDAERRLRPYLVVADDILTLRLTQDWSQTELARQAGTNQANISRLEAGLANPSIAVLQKIADALDAELLVRLRPRTDQPVDTKSTAQPSSLVGPSVQVQAWLQDSACAFVWDDHTSAQEQRVLA